MLKLKMESSVNKDTGAPPPIYAAQHPMYPAKETAQGNTTIVSTPKNEKFYFCDSRYCAKLSNFY